MERSVDYDLHEFRQKRKGTRKRIKQERAELGASF